MSDPVVLLSTGDVVGPAGGVTDNSMVLFSGTSGKLIKGNNAVVTAAGLALLDDVNAAAQRATLGLGTAATANVTTSATDTTAGRLMKVGDFGLGLDAVAVADANTIPASGVYRLEGSSGVNGPLTGFFFTLVNYRYGTTSGAQIATLLGDTTGRTWVRSQQANVWGAWQEIALTNSPTFTGTPTAPTASAGTSTTQVATTAFVTTADKLKANINSPTFTGSVSIPTIELGSQVGASNAYIDFHSGAVVTDYDSRILANAGTGNGTSGYGTLQIVAGVVDMTTGAAGAQTVRVNTAVADTNSTIAASTAFVVGQASSTAPVMDSVAVVGTSLKYARADHVHPSDTTKAPLASPALTGTPTAPTAAAGTNTTQLANTAFVKAAVDAAPRLGVGQTWQDVTSSRTPGVIYTNTSGRPICVKVTHGEGDSYNRLYVDGLVVDESYQGTNIALYTTVSAIVPSGSTYQLFNTGEPGAYVRWMELR